MKKMGLFLALTLIFAAVCCHAGYMDTPYLGDKDSLRQSNLPYDTVKANCIGINYMENLLDARSNITAYSHLNYNTNSSDPWHLQFPDDSARFLEGLAQEADYSPVVRLELARRINKGIIASHINGSEGYYSFRLRFAGKTNLLLDTTGDGWASMSYLGDAMEPGMLIGFDAQKDSKSYPMQDFKYKDADSRTGGMGSARSPEYWNESPYTWKRDFTSKNGKVRANYTSWMSDEYMPMEIKYTSKDFAKITTVLGKGAGGMHIFNGGPEEPATILLPDRKTSYKSDVDKKVTINKPDFNYIILTKAPAWGVRGYGAAVLVMWEGTPDKIEFLPEGGYGSIRITQDSGKKVWVNYMRWLNLDEIDYIFRNADYFMKNKTFIPTDFPMPEMMNATYTGLAAAAYMMTKWNDPFAPTSLAHATRAVDRVFEEFPNEKFFIRAFFPVRAASWMIKTAKVLGDKEMEAKYTKDLEMAMEKALMFGYNGTGWGGSWDHWNYVRAMFMAYDATGDLKYKDLWQKALSEVTVDDKGLYVDGKPMEEPGSFNTYFGSMPIGAWGAAGWLDMCETYMHLNVPAYKTKDSIMVRELWNDAGAGPWAQDDANPEFVGYCLAGLNIPVTNKYVVPVGSFASYNLAGDVTIKNEALVINPFFRAESKSVDTIEPGTVYQKYNVKSDVTQINKECKDSKPLEYKFDVSGVNNGLAYDLDIIGNGYQIDVSPNGKDWYRKYDTKNTKARLTSVDVSNFVGNADEYIKTLRFYGNDKKNISSDTGSQVSSRYRFVKSGKALVYKIDLKNMSKAFAEIIVGNNYKIELSGDGKTWNNSVDSNYYGDGKESPNGGWLRILHLDDYVSYGQVYVKITNLDKLVNPLVKYQSTAFIERFTLYSVFDVDDVYIRVHNVWDTVSKSFTLNKITQRSW